MSSILIHKTRKPQRGTELARLGDPFGFFDIHSVAKCQKNKGDPLKTLIIFRKKSHNAKKIERGNPLVSPGIV